jgi:5-methylcytosine-specific restriction endonuclease McrA
VFNPLRRYSKLNPISKKRKARQPARERAEAVVRDRAKGRCQIAIKGVCLGIGQHGHEVKSRAQGGSEIDPDNMLWACNPCNGWAHAHPIEAFRLGVLYSFKHAATEGEHEFGISRR